MRVQVAEQVLLNLTFSGTSSGSMMAGGYVDLSNFRHARLVVGYSDRSKSGTPACTIEAYPAWQGDDPRATVIGTEAFSEVDLGAATGSSGLLTDPRRSADGYIGFPDAPGAIVQVVFNGVSSDALSATLTIAFMAFA